MRVEIIGGGVAGLAAGIYLQRHGIETTIYERSASVGGLMTGWRRGRYTFNGCLHWLLGSAEGISFNSFWREIMEVERLDFVYHEERVRFDVGGREFIFYNDIDRLESYLLQNAPEDAHLIKRWMGWVRMLVPLLDYLPPVFDGHWLHDVKLQMRLWRLVPVLRFMIESRGETNRTFAQKFRSPWLRDALTYLYQYEINLSVLVFAQAYATKRVAGYPVGGSLAVARQLAESYRAAGGNIQLKTSVNKIIIKNNNAIGVELSDGRRTQADCVVSAADWHWTAFQAIGNEHLPKSLLKFENPQHDDVFYSFCMLMLGVRRPMKEWPHFFRINKKIKSPDGTEYQQIEVNIYNYDATLAPEGCCCISVNFPTREGDFWIALRGDINKYNETKKRFADAIIAELDQYFGGGFASDIEEIDLTTPATYYRYTNNFRGSSQGWSPRSNLLSRSAINHKISGINGLYLAGHWIEAGGGVPVALATAHRVALDILGKF